MAAALRTGGDKLIKLRIVEGGNKAQGACGDEGVKLLAEALRHKAEMLKKGTLVLSGLAVKTEGASNPVAAVAARCLSPGHAVSVCRGSVQRVRLVGGREDYDDRRGARGGGHGPASSPPPLCACGNDRTLSLLQAIAVGNLLSHGLCSLTLSGNKMGHIGFAAFCECTSP